MLEAVLFDWTNTLVEFTWDDDLLVAGHEAALAALGREDGGFTDRYRPVVLESLRARGLKTGIVANSWPEPGRLLRADLEAFGLSHLFDVCVFSTDIGFAKPAPEIFMRALDQIGVDPLGAMYVGDSLAGDVQGAANLGMTTVQALWFRADDTTRGIEPDFMAFTAMDVLNAVRRLAR